MGIWTKKDSSHVTETVRDLVCVCGGGTDHFARLNQLAVLHLTVLNPAVRLRPPQLCTAERPTADRL